MKNFNLTYAAFLFPAIPLMMLTFGNRWIAISKLIRQMHSDFIKRKTVNIGYDKDENPVFLAPSSFLLSQAEGDYPDITFHKTSEFKLDE